MKILTALQAERNTKAPKAVKDEPGKIIGLGCKVIIIDEPSEFARFQSRCA
jgi:hypothetical protein